MFPPKSFPSRGQNSGCQSFFLQQLAPQCQAAYRTAYFEIAKFFYKLFRSRLLLLRYFVPLGDKNSRVPVSFSTTGSQLLRGLSYRRVWDCQAFSQLFSVPLSPLRYLRFLRRQKLPRCQSYFEQPALSCYAAYLTAAFGSVKNFFGFFFSRLSHRCVIRAATENTLADPATRATTFANFFSPSRKPASEEAFPPAKAPR